MVSVQENRYLDTVFVMSWAKHVGMACASFPMPSTLLGSIGESAIRNGESKSHSSHRSCDRLRQYANQTPYAKAKYK